jgi:hypothetical protein
MTNYNDLGPNSIVYDTHKGWVDQSVLNTIQKLFGSIDELVHYRNHYGDVKKPDNYDEEIWEHQMDVFINLNDLKRSIHDLYGGSFTNESVPGTPQD